MVASVDSRIRQRRMQMLVHSYAYYVLDTNIVSDHAWQRWADELVSLQGGAPVRIGFYDEAFADWDGSTGMHLPKDYDVYAKTLQVLALHERYGGQLPPAADLVAAAPSRLVQASLF